eukprot:5593396-Lingulodinium_polyedra.AAC.1
MDQLQRLARVICQLAKPLYTAHSSHAATIRGAKDACQWYVDQAKGAYLADLHAVAKQLADVG